MCIDAARIYGMKVGAWMRRVLSYEAARVRLAAANVPQGLHPGVPVYRVTDAPQQGQWTYNEYFVTNGTERVFVSTFIDDAPHSVAKDGRACVVDVIVGPRKGKNLLVAYSSVRWIGASPLAAHVWVEKAKEEARGE